MDADFMDSLGRRVAQTPSDRGEVMEISNQSQIRSSDAQVMRWRGITGC